MTYVKWIVFAMLGVTNLFLLAMTTSNPESNFIQPLGPKMCDRLCSHRIGCPGYLYSPLVLSCRLIVGKNRSRQLSPELYKPKRTQKIHENDNMTCVRNSKIFRTRRRIMKCRYIQIRRSGLVTYTRLLILPSSIVTLGARQFYLGNRSVATYPNLQVSGVTGVAYMASKRKLLISSFDPRELFSVSLDDKKKSIICRGKPISDMAVDDEKQLIFLSSFSSRGIYAITTEGTHYRLLKNLENNVRGITIDSQKQMIYTAVYRKHILKLTYEGVSQEIVAKGTFSSAICLNSNGSVLYYFKWINEYKLFKLSLPNGIPSETPTPFKPCAHVMYVFSNKLYLSPDNNKEKLSVLSDSGKQIRLINTGYDSRALHVVVCAIP